MKSICLVVIASLLAGQSAVAYTAPAAADPEVKEFMSERGKQKRLLRPVLRKIAELGAFDGEEGKQLFLRALKKAMKANRKMALKNIDRLSNEDLSAQIERSARRLEQDGQPALAAWLDSANKAEPAELRQKLRDLHSSERAQAFYDRIAASIEEAGSVRAAIDKMADCWDLFPLATELIVLLIWVSWEIAILHPLLFLIMLPALVAWIVALPIALIIDYVILLPLCFFLEAVDGCQIQAPSPR